MSRHLPLPILIVLLACHAVASAEDGPVLALGGLDPVSLCEGDERDGLETITAVHGGFLYRFAGEKTRSTFLEAPQRWGIQLDGACGAMPSARGAPDRFAVHDGRIYIFGSDACRTEFMAAPANFLQRRTRTVAILVFDGMELLDFAGPGEVFAAADHGNAFEVFTVSATVEPVTSQGFVTITPERSIESAPVPDILVIPGGGVGALIGDEPMRDWIARTAREAEHVLTVCTGAFVLAELGLLDGLEATTHHGSIGGLRKYEGVTVVDDVRFIDNGRIITTAGVSAGIDGSLHLVRRLLGTESAIATASYMEYDWTPPE